MKKHILYFILSLQLLLLSLSFNCLWNKSDFSLKNVLNNIAYLSSDNMKGRLTGTYENLLAGEYVKKNFIKNGLKEFNGTYYHSFLTKYPKKIDEDPKLVVKDSRGNIEKEYQYTQDYKEDMINFKSNEVTFNKKNGLYIDNSSLQIRVGDKFYLFYVPLKDDLNFRSSFIYESTFHMYVMIKERVLSEIKEYINQGYTISCYIPFVIEDTKSHNIVGKIKGLNSSLPPLIISSHFDHIGSDLKGKIYNGALDNASGISFLMELSKYINSLGKPNRDIIFIGFNAEEFGCLGSKAFAEDYKDYLKNSLVLNFDMIGSDKGIPLSIMGAKDDTLDTNLIKASAEECINKKVNYSVLFEDASDHEYFRKLGIEAITYCDSDMSRIHTPEDRVEYISPSAIDRCFNIASGQIIKNSFTNPHIIIYSKEIFFISALLTALLLIKSALYPQK